MNPAIIKSLTLSRFRSVQEQVVDLSNPCFLVGRNGSGKSNVVDAFAFLAEAMVLPLQAVFDRRGGIAAVRNRSSARSRPPNLGIAIELGQINSNVTWARYAFEVGAVADHGFEVRREQCIIERGMQRHWFDRQLSEFRTSVAGIDPALDSASLALPIIGGDQHFNPIVRTISRFRVHSIDPSKLREFQDPEAPNGLERDGRNAASVLRDIANSSPDDMTRINQMLSSVVPQMVSVRPRKHGNKLSLEFEQDWGRKENVRFEGFCMSDGTLRAVGLLAAVYQRPHPTLLVLEEPESTIHVGAIGAILDLLKHAYKTTQVVVTTHSADVLDAEWIAPEHVRMVDWNQGVTLVSELSEASTMAIRQHLMGAGELMRSNALEPAPVFVDDARQKLFQFIK